MIKNKFVKKTMTCQEFYHKLLADGWEQTGRVGSLISLHYGSEKIVVDLNKDTGFIDPDGDTATKQLSCSTGTTHYSLVSDAVRQPTSPNPSPYTDDNVFSPMQMGSGTVVFTDIYDMSTLTVGSVSNITIWGHLEVYAGTLKVAVYMGGGWTTLTTLVTAGIMYGEWKSASFSGTWTQADLNACQLKVEVTMNQMYMVSTLYETYGVVTYTAGGGAPTYDSLSFGTDF